MSKKHTLTEAEEAMLAALLTDVQPVSIKKRVPAKKAVVAVKSPSITYLPPSTILDLHGLTLALAHRQLAGFIVEHYQRGTRNLLVITGKSGKLMHDVPRWLSLTDLSRMVASISPAPPNKGGAGALIVKLKKHDR